jgi:hypothetical protein
MNDPSVHPATGLLFPQLSVVQTEKKKKRRGGKK